MVLTSNANSPRHGDDNLLSVTEADDKIKKLQERLNSMSNHKEKSFNRVHKIHHTTGNGNPEGSSILEN